VIDFGAPTVPAAYPNEREPRRDSEETGSDLWADSGIGLPKGPVAAFATNPSAPSEEQMPTIGHIGRYALKYRIGEGGLGTVYAAHDPLLSRLIAIKTLNLELSAEERESFNALFLNEARAAAGLSHPHIVTVFDAGTSDNSAYIAMELLKGRDLRQLREEGWRPSPDQAALIVRRVADALAYAHSKGVVHRDVKPANIFMVGRTQPRVLDFGIARVAHRHEGGGGDIAAGSPYYMAPEQVRHHTVDRRADVFSLGVVLYELLTDQKPFRGTTLAEISAAVTDHEPPLASEVDTRVPRGLAEIAARAMVKDPEQRFRSARTFSRELRHWLDENNGAGEIEEPARAMRRSWQIWAGAAATAVVVGGIALFLANTASDAPTTLAARPIDPPAPVAGASAGLGPNTEQVVAAGPAASAVENSLPIADRSSAGVATGSKAGAPAGSPTAAAARSAATGQNAKPRPQPSKPATGGNETGRERNIAKAKATAPPDSKVAMAVKGRGVVRLAVSPWGQVEVDGVAAGSAPPLTELTLNEGKHLITIRNADFPAFSTTVTVAPGQAVAIKHKFGS
jgi:eukaryotic-like serine/threonine-protein kinase